MPRGNPGRRSFCSTSGPLDSSRTSPTLLLMPLPLSRSTPPLLLSSPHSHSSPRDLKDLFVDPINHRKGGEPPSPLPTQHCATRENQLQHPQVRPKPSPGEYNSSELASGPRAVQHLTVLEHANYKIHGWRAKRTECAIVFRQNGTRARRPAAGVDPHMRRMLCIARPASDKIDLFIGRLYRISITF